MNGLSGDKLQWHILRSLGQVSVLSPWRSCERVFRRDRWWRIFFASSRCLEAEGNPVLWWTVSGNKRLPETCLQIMPYTSSGGDRDIKMLAVCGIGATLWSICRLNKDMALAVEIEPVHIQFYGDRKYQNKIEMYTYTYLCICLKTQLNSILVHHRKQRKHSNHHIHSRWSQNFRPL